MRGITSLSRNEANLTAVLPQTSTILACLGQAAFVWDIATDSIAWSDHAGAVFTDIPPEALASGAELAKLIEPKRSVRSEALTLTPPVHGGEAVPYRIEYGVRAATSAPLLWIEETGCWFAGPDGKPARAQGIVRINNERHARDEQLLKLSQHDPLTGELNRTHLIAALAETIEEAQRYRSSCAFMLIGIDHLARVNDAFGFDVADAVISDVARRIRARLRGGDVLGRFSGNKFGLILKNCTVDDMNIAAERFLAGVRDDVVPTRSGPVSVTASVGAVSLPRYARSADEAINRAHETLDSAKRRRAGSTSREATYNELSRMRLNEGGWHSICCERELASEVPRTGEADSALPSTCYPAGIHPSIGASDTPFAARHGAGLALKCAHERLVPNTDLNHVRPFHAALHMAGGALVPQRLRRPRHAAQSAAALQYRSHHVH